MQYVGQYSEQSTCSLTVKHSYIPEQISVFYKAYRRVLANKRIYIQGVLVDLLRWGGGGGGGRLGRDVTTHLHLVQE